MLIKVSVGEIVDKATILFIKSEEIKNETKLKDITNELKYLSEILSTEFNIDVKSEDFEKLYKINKLLWDIEDKIRKKESEKKYDDEFISLARQVYITNDKRAELKLEINLKYKSEFIEHKSYSEY